MVFQWTTDAKGDVIPDGHQNPANHAVHQGLTCVNNPGPTVRYGGVKWLSFRPKTLTTELFVQKLFRLPTKNVSNVRITDPVLEELSPIHSPHQKATNAACCDIIIGGIHLSLDLPS